MGLVTQFLFWDKFIVQEYSIFIYQVLHILTSCLSVIFLEVGHTNQSQYCDMHLLKDGVDSKSGGQISKNPIILQVQMLICNAYVTWVYIEI
jgi:hypothetical protein